jgi:hypothetical protein
MAETKRRSHRIWKAVAQLVAATLVIEDAVSATKKVLDQPVDLAFLDINVTIRKSFSVGTEFSCRR